MRGAYATLALLAVAAIWGATFPVVKIALEYSSPFAFNTVRFFISLFFFIPFLRSSALSSFKDGFKIGIAVFLGYSLQTVGLQYTTASNAGFITSSYIVLTPLVAYLLYKTRLDVRDCIAIALAIVGFYLLSGYSGTPNIGDVLIFLCALAFATEIAMISHYSRVHDSTSLAFWQIFAVFALSAPFAALTPRFVLSTEVAVALLITAFFATFVARVIQNRFQRYTKASHAALVLSMEGVFSHIFAVLILAETLNMVQYAGAALITLAVVLVSLDTLNSGS